MMIIGKRFIMMINPKKVIIQERNKKIQVKNNNINNYFKKKIICPTLEDQVRKVIMKTIKIVVTKNITPT